MAGKGLAAFIAHSTDAYVLRESYRRLNEQQPLKTFNPIHDSFGFHPSDAKHGQAVVLEVMQELGSSDYNVFQNILEANGITLEEFTAAGGVMPDRKHVTPSQPEQIPTALS